jgi:glycosyltransferase involved in cell wall biosynthesis
MRPVWIAWNSHRRTTGLCAAWNVPLHILRPKSSSYLRWIDLSFRTLRLLRTVKPDILFVQNPSLALTVLTSVSRPFFRYYLVVDAHNEGVRPYDRPSAFIRWLTRRVLKLADVTIVSNDALLEDVRAVGGQPLSLPDRLPDVPELEPTRRQRFEAPDVAVIATYRRDEPIAAIIEAAGTMPDVRFAFSGHASHYDGAAGSIPPNVELTGYLPDLDYWELLTEARVICDLTLKPDCLVCGAYEALAVGKPMVLSDNPATRKLFGPAAVLTGSRPEQISAAVRQAIENRERLQENSIELRDGFHTHWDPKAAEVWSFIEIDAAGNARVTV